MSIIKNRLNFLRKRLLNILKVAFTPQKVYLYEKKVFEYHNLSYSQEGEDLILERFFGDKKVGVYVDVGAHHPQRFSNTYLFYLKGWRGINIDAMPGSMEIFNILRPDDINLEIPISDCCQLLTYYEFNEPALNGFCLELSEMIDMLPDYKLLNTRQLLTNRLDAILDEYLPPAYEIDFMSIDVEGLDLQVLRSNNWEKYRPKMILVEELNRSTLYSDLPTELDVFMKDLDYTLYAKSVSTLFFVKNN